MPQPVSRFDRSTDQILATLRRLRGLSFVQRYGITLIVVLAALGIRTALAPLLHGAAFTLFFPAVMIAALLFNSGTGLFATVLCTLLVVLFQPSESQPPGDDPTFLANVAAFLVVGVFTSVTMEALHRATARLAGAVDTARRLESDNRVLLDELNHRVKNSMQVMASLITLRGHRLRDAAAAAEFHALASQVQVLGRLYSRLRFTDSQAEMEAGAFLHDLIEDLRATLVGERPIAIDASIENAYLPVRRMIPLGLVLNELLTNAMKHAFPEGRGGTIRVRLTSTGETIVLQVSDDGVGAADTGQPRLGSRLVEVLAQQLRAQLERRTDAGGTTVRVVMPARDDGEDTAPTWIEGSAAL